MQGWNLLLRFVLEVACLAGIAVAGWMITPALGVVGSVLAAAAWGVSAALAVLVVLHHLAAVPRLRWLLGQRAD